MKVLLIALAFLLMISPLCRVIITHLHYIGIYSVLDVYKYFKNKEYEKFKLFGIDMFCGMFGSGKSLTAVHVINNIYKKYGDSVRYISNIELYGIPYIPLINFQQIVEIGEDKEDKYQGTVVLIDEIENVLSHRNFANFPLSMLHTLMQQRKKKVYILCTSPRYHLVDKIWRSITNRVIFCSKFWRFQHLQYFDAWDYENAMNTTMIKRLLNAWFFVKNTDYNSYSTESMVSKHTAEDFISNDESLVRKGLDSMSNENAIVHKSRKYSKSQKINKKR